MKRFSLNLLRLAKRFQPTLLVLLLFAATLFLHFNEYVKSLNDNVLLTLSIAIPISIATTLWSENYLKGCKRNLLIYSVIALWLVYMFFSLEKIESFNDAKMLEISVLGFVFTLSITFISFLKKGQNLAFWNFSTKILFHAGLAGILGALSYGGLALATQAIGELFDVNTENIFANLFILCFLLLSPIYFLANIPNRKKKFSKTPIEFAKVLKLFALYVLAPLVCIYLIIVYVYACKILISWELPHGGVVMLTSALAFSGLALTTLLFPSLNDKNIAISLIKRYLHYLILPTLVLMSIAIIYRIGEHGLTINRAYILLLNAWFYGSYIYLIIVRSQKIKWLFISAAILALLSSVGPWGIPSVLAT